MKYIVSNNTLSSIVKVAEQIKKPESKVVLVLGGGDAGENVLCQLRLTTDAEQATYNFTAKKPEDWDGSAIITPVDASNFCTVIKSILTFNEDVYIEVEGTILEVGILGKVKTSLPIESQVPEEIKPLTFFYRFEISGGELLNLLNKGCAFTEESVDTKGLHNAVLKLMPETDEIKACSTDGHIVGCTKVKVNFTKAADDDEKKKAMVEAMDKAVTEYCTQHTEQDKNNYNVIIPREAVMHLARFAEGQQKLIVFVDQRFVWVQIGGKTMMYTIKQAGSTVTTVDSVYNIIFQEENAKFCADSQALRNAISFINTNNAISGKDKHPTKLLIKEGEVLVAKSGLEDKIESSIKASDIKGEQFVAFNGKILEGALSALNKGNVVMYAGTKHIALFNGTIDNVDLNSFVFIFQINIAKVEEEAEASEGDGAEESAE